MTGRALSIGWAKENANAILNAWEPGQMGGQAIAEVLTGQVNPSGKLPVTVPRNVGQVQTVYNYKHSQYSRLFATNETGALWPFGYGLSYSTFEYSDATLSKSEIGVSESLKASVTVTNNGKKVNFSSKTSGVGTARTTAMMWFSSTSVTNMVP